jgi:uncharacterized membrane protein
MESVKLSVFDIFVYLLPGLVCLTAIYIPFNPSITSLAGLAQSFKNIGLSTAVMALIAAYIVGHVADNQGSWLYYKIGCRVWGQPHPKVGHPSLSRAQQRALVRQYSPENYLYIQTWKLLKNMSHNLSFAFLMVMIVSAIRFAQIWSIDWAFLVIVSLIFMWSFLYRSHVYDTWHYKELLETVNGLRLEDKLIADIESKKTKSQ